MLKQPREDDRRIKQIKGLFRHLQSACALLCTELVFLGEKLTRSQIVLVSLWTTLKPEQQFIKELGYV